MAARQPPEASAAAGSIEEIGSRGGVQEDAATSSREEAIADVSGNSWEVSLLERQLPDRAAEGLYVFHNTFHLLPRGIGRLGALKTLKLFSNDIEVLPPEVVDLVELERLQLKISSPQISGLSLQKLKSLTELELSKTPPRLSASSILSEISGLKCLTRLSICHFSIRFLPPEVSNLKKLQELDISFNKLKNLPDGIAELSSLKSLNVANNKLVDPPPCISLMSNLERLDLSNNKLTSLTSLRLSSMLTLQHLNLEHNNLPYGFAIPYWVRCKFEGNTQGNIKFQTSSNASEVYDPAIHRTHLSRYCNGCHSTSSCSHLELSNSIRCHVARRMKRRGWNRQIYIQQRGRQERLNYSRKCKGEDPNRSMNLKMVEEADISSFIEPVTAAVFKESAKEDVFHNDDASAVNSDGCCLAKESESNEVGLLESHPEEQSSCATYNSNCVNKDNDFESEREDNGFSFHSISSFDVSDEQSSCETPNVTSKSKRHSEKDLDNPKPSKFRKPVEDCSDLSCKYSIESYCSIDDFIPDGFYDAGRNRPFKSLLDFEQSLCLDSREVILLDREKDEELDAIVFSAQLLMSRLKRSSLSGREDNIVDDLYRASILALFVSDCFGGSERSGSIMKMRRSLLGSRKQQPFVCTCSAGYNFEKTRLLENKRDNEVNVNFSELCDNSLQVIKKSRNSNIVPIGTLRFGVCRHRAVLMKYLCDRVDPPIPCELIRGYLDFMPHAWNTVCVRRGNSCVRMVVDACYPTDIREETDLEYFCRYVPLSRFLVPLETGNSTVPTLSIPFSLNYQIKSTSRSIIHCKFGTLDAAIKVRYLIAEQTSIEEIRAFEHMLLGEVRILGALRNHKHIVHIHGHQLSCKWLPAEDGNKDHRLLQSMIIMEHVNGGSLKSYLDRLKEKGRKHAPVDIALCIARDVACALVEVHSKQIIHRDIKSENILVDFASRSDTVPAVKLCDFDRSVPLHCSAHTCCIAHLGIHPPNVCVGTPRWMAPEVVQAMHQKQSYGLEVDIWSYGCLLLELLTLELPYQGLSESELYKLLQMQQRPMLTPELEALTVASQDETTAQSKTTAFSSNAEAEILKCLVDLFFQCTHGDPSHRPSAKHIYDSLLSISSRLETADHDTVGSD